VLLVDPPTLAAAAAPVLAAGGGKEQLAALLAQYTSPAGRWGGGPQGVDTGGGCVSYRVCQSPQVCSTWIRKGRGGGCCTIQGCSPPCWACLLAEL
jgi:hypothetical protein